MAECSGNEGPDGGRVVRVDQGLSQFLVRQHVCQQGKICNVRVRLAVVKEDQEDLYGTLFAGSGTRDPPRENRFPGPVQTRGG